MLAFMLGLIISVLLCACLLFEICAVVRPLFSIVFLGGIIALFFVVFTAGLLLTPLFLIGFIINLILFLPIIAAGGSKDDRK